MNEKELSMLSELKKYVNDNNAHIDKIKLLTEVSIIGVTLLNPQISGPASTTFTLAGIGIPAVISNCFEKIKTTPEEEKAIDTLKRCQFADFILARLAVVQVVRHNLRGKDRVFADWKMSQITEEDRARIESMDQEREENFVNDLFRGTFNKEVYWNELLNVIIRILELKDVEIDDFKEKMKDYIYGAYEAFKNYLIYSCEYFKIYKNSYNQSEMCKKWDELEGFLNLYGKLYKTIDEFEDWLKEVTMPTISLNFYNYNEENFEKEFINKLSEKVIYVKGKTQEEVVMYVLYILKNIEKTRKNDVFIVDSIENWHKLDGHCKGKILIPNFNTNEISIIPGNTCIIAFGEEDLSVGRNTIELKQRIQSNMHNMLYNECGDLELSNSIINKTNGLYTSFKRIVFQGNLGNPKWERFANKELVPALLLGKWDERYWRDGEELGGNGDLLAVENLSCKAYSEYIQSLKALGVKEDPFVLRHRGNNGGAIYKLSNVEEAWAILFQYISKETIDKFKKMIVTALTEIPPKFVELPIEEHYKAGILEEKPIYSDVLKNGMIRSLIMLANKEGIENNFGEYSTQKYIDNIVDEIFSEIDSEDKWFAISEHVDDLIEASPKVVLKILEKETSNSESIIWSLFEKQNRDSFGGVNYYTHILWALEKTLCFKEYVITSIRILAKLAERKIEYKISNSPLASLHRALRARVHDINATIDDKIDMTKYIVKNTVIGWELLKLLLPDSVGSMLMSSTKPRYRSYEIEYRLETKKQVYDTYEAYTKIAINEAGKDLNNWKILFEKFSFSWFNLEDLVISSVRGAIKECHLDHEKYCFKESIRDLIHRHRFFKNSNWEMSEDYIERIEKEVFDFIKFDNEIFEYLYLFKTDRPPLIHIEPYNQETHDYEKERWKLKTFRRETITKIQQNQNLDLIQFIKYLTSEYKYGYGLTEIGEMIAQFHNFNINYEFINKMIKFNQKIVICAYVDIIYNEKGIIIIQEVVDYYKKEHRNLVIDILKIIKIDKEFLDLLENYESKIVQEYWRRFWFLSDVNDRQVLNLIWKKLLQFKNYKGAIELLQYSLDDDIPKHIELLDKISIDPGEYRIDSHDSYYIAESFEKIYNSELSKEVENFIWILEWRYFKILIDQIEPKYLTQKFKQEPEFLAELIKYTYMDKNIALNENELFFQKQASKIVFEIICGFRNWNVCPCVNNQGHISLDGLRAWVNKFLEIIDLNGNSAVGRQILGKCLSDAPIDSEDGIFPHRAVREIFEEYYDEDLQKGFRLGIVNSRGAHTCTDGREEKNISDKYQIYWEKTRIAYPKMSETLKLLEEEYLYNSTDERERAVYGM